jgi:hypothetical protein
MIMKPLLPALLLMLIFSGSPDLAAQDSLQLEGTAITVNM